MSISSLTRTSLPSSVRTMLAAMVQMNPVHPVIVSRLVKQDLYHKNKGDRVARISVEKLPLLGNESEEMIANSPLVFKYSKVEYQYQFSAGHLKLSSALLDTSIEMVAETSETLLSVACIETSEHQIIKTLMQDARSYDCVNGSTAQKVGQLTEINLLDLANIYMQLRLAQQEPCYPMPIFGSPWWGSVPRKPNSYALILPAEAVIVLENLARYPENMCIPIEKASSAEAYHSATMWGFMGNFSIYLSTLMSSYGNDLGAADNTARIYEGLILAQGAAVMVNGLDSTETIYRGRVISSPEASFCTIGKRFVHGGCILRPSGVWKIRFCDYKKA